MCICHVLRIAMFPFFCRVFLNSFLRLYVRPYVGLYVCLYVCSYLCLRLYVRPYVGLYVCLYVCSYLCLARVSACLCIYVCLMRVSTCVSMCVSTWVPKKKNGNITTPNHQKKTPWTVKRRHNAARASKHRKNKLFFGKTLQTLQAKTYINSPWTVT